MKLCQKKPFLICRIYELVMWVLQIEFVVLHIARHIYRRKPDVLHMVRQV